MQPDQGTATINNSNTGKTLTLPRDGESDDLCQHASLVLSGEWLKQLGFSVGQAVDIRIEPGRIVIRLPDND